LSFGYGERFVLEDISLTIPRGKVTALMGASGGGKTTMLRLIGGQVRAQRGEVLFDGNDVGKLDHDGLYAIRRRMGMLFQFGALFADLSVFDNVAFPLREHSGLPEDMIRDVVLMKLEAVIALDPDLIMYDEPFSGLDPISLGAAARLVRQLNDTLGITSLVVSHEIPETFHMSDQVIVLANGRIAEQGTPQQVRESSDPLVYQFVHGLSDGPIHFHYPGPTVTQDFSGGLA
jgi:phospholipid/cholesterol/gamma-HCH transport system ATP-binding protein